MGVRSTFQLSRTTGLNALLARAYRRIFFGSLFTWFERCGFHFLPVDYSSLVPDTRALRKRLPEWYRATLEERISLISPRLTDKQIEKYKEQWR